MSDINSIQVMRNGEPLSSYEEAYAFLVGFTRHMIGQIVEVIYWKEPAEGTTNDPVGALVAIGTKNWTECGPSGVENPDRYLNKYYPIEQYPYGPCGEEFFELIGSRSGGGGGGTPYNTTFTLNGAPVVVANNNDQDESVTDPFIWENLVFNN